METMTLEQIETRKAEILEEIKTADEARLAELTDEVNALEERKAELVKEAEVETRKKNIEAVIAGAGKEVEAPQEERTMENVLESRA